MLVNVLHSIYNIKHQILFFMGVGIFGESLIPILSNIELSLPLIVSKYLIIIIPIIVIPVISILMIHPLVLFIITAPLITPHLISYGFDNITIYLIWIIMLINLQLLSPVSLTTVLAVENNNIFLESFIKHYKFVFKLCIVSISYITIINMILKFLNS